MSIIAVLFIAYTTIYSLKSSLKIFLQNLENIFANQNKSITFASRNTDNTYRDERIKPNQQTSKRAYEKQDSKRDVERVPDRVREERETADCYPIFNSKS